MYLTMRLTRFPKPIFCSACAMGRIIPFHVPLALPLAKQSLVRVSSLCFLPLLG
jgi:hypothetical protein